MRYAIGFNTFCKEGLRFEARRNHSGYYELGGILVVKCLYGLKTLRHLEWCEEDRAQCHVPRHLFCCQISLICLINPRKPTKSNKNGQNPYKKNEKQFHETITKTENTFDKNN